MQLVIHGWFIVFIGLSNFILISSIQGWLGLVSSKFSGYLVSHRWCERHRPGRTRTTALTDLSDNKTKHPSSSICRYTVPYPALNPEKPTKLQPWVLLMTLRSGRSPGSDWESLVLWFVCIFCTCKMDSLWLHGETFFNT